MFDFDAADRAAPFGWAGCTLPAGLAALHEVQWRNVAALMAANRTALAGYQDVYARTIERCTAALAEGRDRMEAMHGRPLDAGTAAQAVADAGAAMDRALVELSGLAGMAQTVAADAFAILLARVEEAMAEIRRAGEWPDLAARPGRNPSGTAAETPPRGRRSGLSRAARAA